MKILLNVALFCAMLLVISCQNNKVQQEKVKDLVQMGKFEEAEKLLRLKIIEADEDKLMKLEIELETIERIRKEFSYTRDDIKTQFLPYYPKLSDDLLNKWESDKQLEMRLIDGEKRYFKRAVSNFFRLNELARQLKDSIKGAAYDGVDDFQLTVIPEYFQNPIQSGTPFDTRRIKVDYTIRLKADAVPNGKTVKCWMPYPRTGSSRLPNVEFLSASEKDFIVAPNSKLQRTVYMEKEAQENQETVFSISFIMHTAAQWFKLMPEDALPYQKESELYKTYTRERLPHVIFSDDIVSLAQEIVGEEKNPIKQVQLLFYWIHNNIPWTGALEYSTMPCIPAYVMENKRGDCGMKTLFFLSMARSLGIPCKWQSGWYLLPQEKNLHDWAEVYYEGIGWVPADISFGVINSDKKEVKDFYISGMDSYRLVVNDDYGQELFPQKQYYRSEPLDFQRGELEWDGGNLYFDAWSYHMDVDYLDE